MKKKDKELKKAREQAVELLNESETFMVLSDAGVKLNCGGIDMLAMLTHLCINVPDVIDVIDALHKAVHDKEFMIQCKLGISNGEFIN